MQEPSLEEIDEIRKQGLRPQVVGCFLSEKKILFLFKQEHNLWQLPQGGIDNQETINQALIREMAEELGKEFASRIDNHNLIGQSQIIFPSDTQNSRKLETDQKEKIFMKGKKYFFVCINMANPDIDIKKTEFNDCQWALFDQAMELTNGIYQKGKKRITIEALDLLKELGLL